MNSKIRIVSLVSTLACLVVISAGCGKKPDTPSDSNMPKLSPAMQILEASQKLYYAEDADGALAILEKGIDDPSIVDNEKRPLFEGILFVLLSKDNACKAEEAFLRFLDKEPAVAELSVGTIINYYSRAGKTRQLIEWHEKLLNSPLSKETKSRLFNGLVLANYKESGIAASLEILNTRSKDYDASVTEVIYPALLSKTLQSRNIAESESLIKVIEELSKSNQKLKTLAGRARSELNFQKANWDEAIADFKAIAKEISDRELKGFYSRAYKEIVSASLFTKADDLSRFVIKEIQNKPAAKKGAAGNWVASARNQNKPAEIVTRLSLLESIQIDQSIIEAALRKHLYYVVESGSDDDSSNLIRLIRKISSRQNEQKTKGRLSMMIIDACFMKNDYATALEIVLEGIPGRDQAWHDYASNKLKAHVALQQGNKTEAIKHFREFMNFISQSSEKEIDPSTGITHTKEMILGRNAKRIGDIYLSMDDKKRAATSYKEAIDYFKTAEEEAKQMPKTDKILKQEISETQKALSALN